MLRDLGKLTLSLVGAGAVICAIMFLAIVGAGIATATPAPNPPMSELVSVARETGYTVFKNNSPRLSVAIPPSVFGGQQLDAWHQDSANHTVGGLSDSIFRIMVNSPDYGKTISGVSIEYFGTRLTYGKPFPLNGKETEEFVRKAIVAMRDRPKVPLNKWD